MKKYKVRVDYGYITETAAYYEVEAENEDNAMDKAVALLEKDIVEIEYWEPYITSEEEI